MIRGDAPTARRIHARARAMRAVRAHAAQVHALRETARGGLRAPIGRRDRWAVRVHRTRALPTAAARVLRSGGASAQAKPASGLHDRALKRVRRRRAERIRVKLYPYSFQRLARKPLRKSLFLHVFRSCWRRRSSSSFWCVASLSARGPGLRRERAMATRARPSKPPTMPRWTMVPRHPQSASSSR